jgi:hypothetical protein
MHVDQEYDSTLTLGQRLSDKIAFEHPMTTKSI